MKKMILGLSLVASTYLSAQTVNLAQGWTNLGVTNDAAVSEIQNSHIKYVWRFTNNNWEIYSPNADTMNSVEADIASGNVSYNIISSPLVTGDALWIYTDAPITLSLGMASLHATVTGIVKDAVNNNLITNAHVSIYSESGTLLPDTATSTDANGTFEFVNIPGGRYTFSFDADNYNELNITSDVTSEAFNMGQVRMIPVATAMYVSVNGQVINAVDGSGVSDANVSVIPGFNNAPAFDGESLTQGQSAINTSTDANGQYNLDQIEAGQYTLVIKHDGYYNYTENVTIFDENNNSAMSLNESLTPQLTSTEILRAKVEWGATPTDLDSHLVSYNTNTQTVNWHLYYANPTPTDSNATLDRDDTDGYGPETTTLNSIDDNDTYKYYIFNYSGDDALKNSDAKVDIVYNGRMYHSEVPYEDGNVWKVFEIKDGVLTMCETGCMSDNESARQDSISYNDISNMRVDISEQKSLRKIEEDIQASVK